MCKIFSVSCDKFQKGIRENFLSFQGDLSKMYRKILNSDQGDLHNLVKSSTCMFKRNFRAHFREPSQRSGRVHMYGVFTIFFFVNFQWKPTGLWYVWFWEWSWAWFWCVLYPLSTGDSSTHTIHTSETHSLHQKLENRCDFDKWRDLMMLFYFQFEHKPERAMYS